MIGLAVFDLDGTLVDSRRDLANATNALLEELGARPLDEEQVGRMVGDGAVELVRRALQASALDPATPGALERFLELYDARLLEHTRPYDGIPEVLRELARRVPLAILTNKPARATERILEGLGLLAPFHAVIGGDTVFGRKPDPGGLLHLTRRAGVDESATLLVGDSRVDLLTAHRARTRICLAAWGFGFRFEPGELPDAVPIARSPAEILAVACA
jgi:phosphoglycolate phosphatase